MRRAVVAPLVAAWALASVSADAGSPKLTDCAGGDPKSCNYILAATAELTTMLTNSDPAPLRRHLDPRALWVSTRGEVRTGAELIEVVRTDTRRATARLDRANARFFGNVAIVTWEESWTAPGATAASGRLAGVDTWARRHGHWKLITTVETRLP